MATAPGKKLAPKQARSRASTERLLQAAETVLEERGLDGATIPRIASKAGLTPGAVYRRFKDKDALLQQVTLNLLESGNRNVQKYLVPEQAKGTPLPVLIDRIVTSVLYSHRKKGRLVRALRDFAVDHPNAAFRKKVDALEKEQVRRILDYLGVHSAEIKHHDPKLALSFGIMLVFFAIRELIISANSDMWESWAEFLPKNDIELQRELSRAFLRYIDAR